MSDPTVKFCLDHLQKWLQIFQVSGKAGRFGLVKLGHLPNFSPNCLFLEGTFKIVIDIAKKKVQNFFNSTLFRGVLWTHSYINSPWCFIGAKSMPYHRSKKVLFWPYLSFENKKSFLVSGCGWVKSDFSVSLCPFLNV